MHMIIFEFEIKPTYMQNLNKKRKQKGKKRKKEKESSMNRKSRYLGWITISFETIITIFCQHYHMFCKLKKLTEISRIIRKLLLFLINEGNFQIFAVHSISSLKNT